MCSLTIGMYGMVETAIKDYGFVRDYVFDQAKNQVSFALYDPSLVHELISSAFYIT